MLSFDLLCEAGRAFLNMRALKGADACFTEAMEQYPDLRHVAMMDAMAVKMDLRQEDAALALADEYLKAFPKNPVALTRKGMVYTATNRFAEAEEAFRGAQKTSKYDPQTESAFAALLEILEKDEEAIACWARAIEAAPNSPQLRMYLGMTVLRNAKDYASFRVGWENYDARIAFANTSRPNGKRIWRGEPDDEPEGKTLAVFAEQGLGDNIMAFRFLTSPMMKEFGFKRIHFVLADEQYSHSYVEYFSTNNREPSVPLVVTHAKDLNSADYDLQCPILNLPRIAFYRDNPNPDGDLVLDFWDGPYRFTQRPHPAVNLNKFNVGLCYRGGTAHPNDRLRSIPKEEFLKALPDQVPAGCAFHLLHMDPGGPEFDEHGIQHTPTPTLLEFEQLISSMSLVITVDTSTAHIAGSLGVPVIMLAAKGKDWRWNHHKQYWYNPTLFDIIQQEEAANWRPLVGRLKAMLEAMGQ